MDIEEYEKKLKNGELLELDLDSLGECPSPSSKYDIGGLRHYIIIEKKNKNAFIEEVVKDYKELIEDMLEEMNEDDY